MFLIKGSDKALATSVRANKYGPVWAINLGTSSNDFFILPIGKNLYKKERIRIDWFHRALLKSVSNPSFALS
jgi:hypothetical protein